VALTRTRYCRLDAEPDELEEAGDVDALFSAVAVAVGVDLAPYEAAPLRVWVQPGAEITRLARETGATSFEAKGLCLSDTCVLVQRLSYHWTLAHEMAHALGRHRRDPVDCAEASRIADAVA